MTTIAVIIARQGSSRLPGKALKPVMNTPLIGIMAKRIIKSPHISEVWVATSTSPEDQAIAAYCESEQIPVFRGDPEDVLKRLHDTVVDLPCDSIVEVGGDCPFVSTSLIETGMKIVGEEADADVVSNALIEPFSFPVGYDFIYVKKTALINAHQNAKLRSERFQPFQYMINHPDQFKVRCFAMQPSQNHLRWTLDYPEDYELVQAVYHALYPKNPDFGYQDIVDLLAQKPELLKLNQKYAEPVSVSTAWFTGSYVNEIHTDIQGLLDRALKLEKSEDYGQTVDLYHQVQNLAQELKNRAEHREKN